MSDLRRLRADLLRWYRRNARPFPWRTTKDPYRILVSEVMLQQTQASRVVPFYRAFLRRIPTMRALARATPGMVIRAWQGLGYNSRAVRLHDLAVRLQADRRGKLPVTVEELQTLPGLGPYTARAVACFAFGQPVAVLDTNVRRVLYRLFPQSNDRTDFQRLADRLLPRRSANAWNQAMMELGATTCTPSAPRCPECPLVRHCPSAGRAVRRRVKPTASEPLYRGHPRRIYRGRIVSALHRKAPRASTSDVRIAGELFPKRRAEDRSFVRSLLSSLERDRLIVIIRTPARWQVRLMR